MRYFERAVRGRRRLRLRLPLALVLTLFTAGFFAAATSSPASAASAGALGRVAPRMHAATSASTPLPGGHQSGGLVLVPKWHVLLGQGTAIVGSSPNIASLGGSGPSIVVGSRMNGCVYAVELATGSTTPGWPRCTGAGIDSTPAVLPASGGLDDVVVTTGDVAGQDPPVYNPGTGSVYEYGPSGNTIWSRTLPDVYGSFGPAPAIEASPAVGDTGNGQTSIVAGTVGLSIYSLDASNGATTSGWPQKTADTTFATAAIANIDGQQTIVAGSDSTAGPGALDNWNGGAVRTLSATGQTGWTYASNEVVTSSPAVGNLDGSGPVVAFGHGRYWWNSDGASDADGLTVVNAATGALEWERHLGGYTRASPALADLTGNGQLDVVEPTWTALGQSTGGVVYAFGPTGNTLWGPVTLPAPGGNTIAGGVATADFGGGYQDVVVASGLGFDVLDGRTGSVLATEGLNVNWDGNYANLAMQNTPLVVPDPSGNGLDIVVAGYYGGPSGDNTQGFIAAYQVEGSPSNVGSGAWPMFHHDPQLTGSAIPPAPPPGTCVPAVPPCTTQGYDLAASDGGIFSFGSAPFYGSMGGKPLNAPIVGIAADPATGGYWEVASDGGIFAFNAPFYGSMGGKPLNKPIVGIAATADGGGYWEVASDGGIFAFGDATFAGSMGGKPLNAPIVGIAATAQPPVPLCCATTS